MTHGVIAAMCWLSRQPKIEGTVNWQEYIDYLEFLCHQTVKKQQVPVIPDSLEQPLQGMLKAAFEPKDHILYLASGKDPEPLF